MKAKNGPSFEDPFFFLKLRGQDLNLRPLGYEPNELPDCSTPRRGKEIYSTGPSLSRAMGETIEMEAQRTTTTWFSVLPATDRFNA